MPSTLLAAEFTNGKGILAVMMKFRVFFEEIRKANSTM